MFCKLIENLSNVLKLFVFLLLLFTYSQSMAFDDKTVRFALIIGNGNYATAPLPNAINDANAISIMLTKLNFKVTKVIDNNYFELKKNVKNFYANVMAIHDKKKFILIYYAGHAIQVEHRNYFVPIDSTLENSEINIKDNVSRGLARLKNANNKNTQANLFDLTTLLEFSIDANSTQSIIILDACRNNPFKNNEGSSFSTGLAPIKAPTGTLIAYATEPGSVASDGAGANGTYTKHLLRHMEEMITIEALLKKVRKGVVKETQNNQIPWEHSSLLEQVFINPPKNKKIPELMVF